MAHAEFIVTLVDDDFSHVVFSLIDSPCRLSDKLDHLDGFIKASHSRYSAGSGSL
jgi:hypothetical protein